MMKISDQEYLNNITRWTGQLN